MKSKLKNILLMLFIGIFCLNINTYVLADENTSSECIDDECLSEEEITTDNIVTNESVINIDDNSKLSNDIVGSSVLVGSRVNLDKNVDGLSLLLANDIEFNGTTEYLLSLGSSVKVNGVVNKDLFLAGSSVKFDESTIIKRDALIAGSSVVIKGTFERDILIFGETVDLQGVTINGDIKIYANSIKIDDNTVISGKLEYNKDANIDIANDANISQIVKLDSIMQEETFMEYLQTKLFELIRLIVLFALLTIIIPKVFDKFNKYSQSLQVQDTFSLLCYGIVVLFVIPVVSILLMISTVASSVGLILLVLYFIAIYMSHILSGYILGNIVWDKLIKKEKDTLLVGIIGIIVIFVFRQIPIIGDYITVISILMGLGILYKNLKHN